MINLEKIAKEIRKEIVLMHYRSKASHIGSALSVVDILVVLYFKVLNIDPNNPSSLSRDYFILSKGHAASAWYAVLAERGFFSKDLLKGYCMNGGKLPEHPDRFSVPGIEASTGSLGHGLPISVGIALAGKQNKCNYKVFVLMSDGECEEGSVWEGAITAPRLKLDNLIAIVDANKLQAYEKTDNIQKISSLKYKFKDFGWRVKEVNGHDLSEMERVFRNVPLEEGKPTMVIAHTIKGKGIKEMENRLEWHYKSPRENEVKKFIEEIEGTR